MQTRQTTHSPLILAWLAAVLGLLVVSTAKPNTPEISPPVSPPFSGPLDLLRSREITVEDFGYLVDGQSWLDVENEFLFKMMYWLHRDFRPTLVQQWTHEDLDLGTLSSDPDTYRGELFGVKCQVLSIEKYTPEQEIAERFEMTDYFRCQVQLEPDDQPAVLFARFVPSSWKSGETINQRASANALFLKLGGERPEHPTPIFVTQRVAWHPETLLGDLGMDAGRFDDLRLYPEKNGDSPPRTGIQGKRLTTKNRECFYQLLAAAGRAEPGQLLLEANRKLETSGQPTFSVVPLFNEPWSQHGELVAFTGIARQILPVRISDVDIIERFGIRQYYQIFLFTDDSQENPLVFCVHELPEGIPTGEGPQFGEHITVAGFFFNAWAYRNRRGTASPNESPWQLAPLSIGREIVWHPVPDHSFGPLSSAIAGVLFLFVLMGVWWFMWQSSRGDKEFHDKTLARQFALDDNISLDHLGLDADARPDFTGLEQDDSR